MVVHSKKKENLTDEDILAGEHSEEVFDNQGDRWTFVAVLPESSYVHTLHHGQRTLEEAITFIAELKSRSDGQAPCFFSDCWFYGQALTDNYCTYQEVPYKGRGRRPHPIQVVDPALRYAQVHKKRDEKGRIEDISTRIVLGDEIQILQLLHDALRSKTINTSYVESRNGKFRKDDARLIRKTLCHSKKAIYPLLLIYGDKDNIVDKRSCDIIFDAWKFEKKKYMIIENGTHGKTTVKLAENIINEWIADIKKE